MQRATHILISRLLACLAFAMFLILTPRAWIDPGTHGSSSEEVPVQTLEKPSDCLWCDTPETSSECDENDEPRMWLNPDQPPALDSPCSDDDAEDSEPSA